LPREQRYEIGVLLRAGKRQKEIAELIGKDKSVISMELKRNSHKRGYSACLAQECADEHKERIGDWEVDTIVGPANKGAVLTAMERTIFLKKTKFYKPE
jgi:IS30 family transposase